MSILPLFVAIPLGAAFVIPVFSKRFGKEPDLVGNLATFSLLIMSIFTFGRSGVYRMGAWPAPIGINLVLDGLTSVMLFTVALVSFAATLFSVNYMKKYTSVFRYYSLFLLMVAGMNGVILTGDMFNMYVFLEIASIASYALVGFGCQSEELEASFKYMVMGSVASSVILFGIALLYGVTGTLNMADIATKVNSGNMLGMFAVALFMMGFGLKAAIIPFHAWLPDAHPSAPAPISAMLSGVLIKAIGVYALMRILFNVFGMNQIFSSILMFLGCISMVVGSFLLLGQKDYKRLLAYSSVSQIGYIFLSFGLGTPLGILGGLFHLMNHASIKSMMFLNSGAVQHATGTRDLEKMGGIAKKMPVTGLTSFIGSMAVSGIPPFNGFWSKLIIVIACAKAGHFWYGFWAVFASLMTLGGFLKIQKLAFFGEIKEEFKNIKEAPGFMLASMVILAVCCLVMGVLLLPGVKAIVLDPAVNVLLDGTKYAQFVLGGKI